MKLASLSMSRISMPSDLIVIAQTIPTKFFPAFDTLSHDSQQEILEIKKLRVILLAHRRQLE